MSRWLEGRVAARKAWTDKLHSIEVEALALTFVAGQFARLALPAPPGAKEPMIGRPYSFVNPPGAPRHEFFFSVVPDGPLSPRLAALAPGDPIEGIELERAGAFAFVPVVSREAHPGALPGRIPALIADGRLEARAGVPLTADNAHAMLCGNPAMVDDVQATLATRGMRRHRRREPGHVTVETYW